MNHQAGCSTLKEDYLVYREFWRIIAIGIVALAIIYPSCLALDLELIFHIKGNWYGDCMGWDAQSWGDVDGDGFSEVFVASMDSNS